MMKKMAAIAPTVVAVAVISWMAEAGRIEPDSHFLAEDITTTSARAMTQEPTAGEILDRALAAMGGEGPLSDLEGWYREGSIAIQGLTGAYKEWAGAPALLKYDVDLRVVHIVRGFDGEEAWEQRGQRVRGLLGTERDELARRAQFLPLLAWKRSGTEIEVVGKTRGASGETWVVEVRPSVDWPGSARAERIHFDAATFLPVREVRRISTEDGETDLVTTWSDWRRVEGVRVPFSMTIERRGQIQTYEFTTYRLNELAEAGFFANPQPVAKNAPWDIRLATIPRAVFKENEGVFADGPTESWVVHVLVDEAQGRRAEPVVATVEMLSKNQTVKQVTFSARELAAVEGLRFVGFAEQPEVFDLRHYFSEPVKLEIDRMEYRLTLRHRGRGAGSTIGGKVEEDEEVTYSLTIPLARYEPKTELIYPLRGKFVVVAGHAHNEPHKAERSQHYADDIVGLGPGYAVCRTDCAVNEDFYAWGIEVLAPAAGTVVYARDDIEDNSRPGHIELDKFAKADDPTNAVGGNNVILDHGNGEYSLLAHLQKGSVRVERGDVVKRGQVLGQLGNSGNSDAPHLHYHLMAGSRIFQSDGLPAKFVNVVDAWLPGGERPTKVATPKRGQWLVAE